MLKYEYETTLELGMNVKFVKINIINMNLFFRQFSMI